MDDVSSPRLAARRLYADATVRVDHVVATAATERPTAPRTSSAALLVLPHAGLFATHFSRREVPVTGANQALFVPAEVEHRYSYPGRVGDRCLAIAWTDDGGATPRRPLQRLLPPAAMLEREHLRALLRAGIADPLAVGESIAALRSAVFDGIDAANSGMRERGHAGARRRRAIERVHAAIASNPTARWTLDALASRAALSAHHLAQVFRREVGTSLYEYVVRARLAHALEAVLESDRDLATVAADAGFANHSHFTARFRARFGVTPHALRRVSAARLRHVRIVTAGTRSDS